MTVVELEAHLHNGLYVGSRFPRTGLSTADDIMALHNDGYSLSLDFSGLPDAHGV